MNKIFNENYSISAFKSALYDQDSENDMQQFQEDIEQQELRQRSQRSLSRACKRGHHLSKKNHAPSLGDLLAPGVPSDMKLVFADPTIVFSL
jgi:hypothetical protein